MKDTADFEDRGGPLLLNGVLVVCFFQPTDCRRRVLKQAYIESGIEHCGQYKVMGFIVGICQDDSTYSLVQLKFVGIFIGKGVIVEDT